MPTDLAATADRQLGLVTRRQCKAVGVTVGELRWANGRTTRIVLPGVLALFTGDLSDRQRLLAAALYAGADAQLAGISAVRWHGLGDVPDDGRHRFLVPASCGIRSSGFVIMKRTTRPDVRPWRRGLLTVCSPARAVVDAGRELRHPEAVRALVLAAVQRRRVRPGHLLAEVEAGAIRGSAVVRRAVADAHTGAWSVPELDVLSAASRSPILPRIWPNPVLMARDGTTLPTPDGWIDDVGLAIQVHSRQYHLRDEHWEATVSADTMLGEYGVPVIAVTPRGFAEDPAGFVARLERAYRQLGRRGVRPDVSMRPRGPGALPVG